MSTIFIILGSADLVILMVMTVHIIPAFLLLNIAIPLPLKHVLDNMMQINNQSLLMITDVRTGM